MRWTGFYQITAECGTLHAETSNDLRNKLTAVLHERTATANNVNFDDGTRTTQI